MFFKTFLKILKKGVDKHKLIWYYKCVPYGTIAN